MKMEEKKWRHHVKEFGTNGVLVTNCIAAAAFLTYCGGMNTDARYDINFYLKKTLVSSIVFTCPNWSVVPYKCMMWQIDTCLFVQL